MRIGRRILIVTMFVLLLAAACSPQAGGGSVQNATPRTPTTSPTEITFPTYAFNPPTEAPQIQTAVAATAAAAAERAASGALDPQAVERGKGRYEALTCGDCHGVAGEGVPDKGSALIGMTLSETDFITYLRSGGEVGITHQYATNRLSESGAKNLYQYVLSLSAE